MCQSARTIAENETTQTFINCYLREVDAGCWHRLAEWRDIAGRITPFRGSHVLELSLEMQRATLAIDIHYRSLVGRHQLGAILLRQRATSEWTTVDPFAAVQLLVGEMYFRIGGDSSDLLKTKSLELSCRLLDSYQLMARYIKARRDDPALDGDRFIESEQSMLYGHWAHPTPKSRQGMLDWHHEHYAPELAGCFQLHYFAAKRDLILQHSANRMTAEEMVLDGLKGCLHTVTLDSHEVPLPSHPLQAQWLLHQPHVRQALAAGLIRDLGPLGPAFTATSSARTLYAANSPWMFKLSMPVKITNSLRFNQRHELRAGVVMSKLLRKSAFCQRHPRFQLLEDPASMTIDLPGIALTGFETIIRANPFKPGEDRGIHSIAALVQAPLPGRRSRLLSLIDDLAQREGRSKDQVSRDWFCRYLQCAVEPLIKLLDEHGIALEAHQQNSLLDVSQGYPRRYFYRDNQGFYLANTYRPHLEKLEPDLSATPELFYADDLIQDRFGYYLVVNQLFSVINRFGIDGVLKEEALLAIVLKRLVALRPVLRVAGRALVDGLLANREMPYKGNLLTRIHDVDELTARLEQAVYTRIKNPLSIFSYGALPETASEVA
ncbi:IucA/IucC family protein [Allohahella marinimesophila]|uniref:IucA/IucC family protein n=1 Tax=Allohahella marinimesophila TaxID=1054972 RepID=A0ABP7NXD2_9GAMM